MLKQVGWILCVATLCFSQASVVVIDKERGKYDLDFDATYQTYINQDIETAIILPAGYKFVASMPGSRDFVSAGPLQNTMYVSCPVDHDVLTNLTLHVITPEGAEEKLIFKLIGRKSSPKVLAIEFQKPNNSEMNRTVEAVKARYTDQMNVKLTEQEKELSNNVHKSTIVAEKVFFIKGKRGKVNASFKGASFWIDGMVNSRGNTFIYVKTATPKDACDIVKLSAVKERWGGKEEGSPAELFGMLQNDDGSYSYVYSVPEIQIPAKGKIKRIKIAASIWSKRVTLKFKVS